MTVRRFFPIGFAVLASILVCILWLDRPLARFMAEFHLGYALFTSAPVKTPVMVALALAGALLGLGYLIAGRKQPKWVEAAMLAGIAVLAGQWLTHELLKPLFGRLVPSVYITSGRYGFHWFHHGYRVGAFPSGHSTEAAAMLSVAWMYYPRWRWAYVAMMACLALALMLGQWHYLSDIIAGTALGILLATAAMLLWRRLRPFRGRLARKQP